MIAVVGFIYDSVINSVRLIGTSSIARIFRSSGEQFLYVRWAFTAPLLPSVFTDSLDGNTNPSAAKISSLFRTGVAPSARSKCGPSDLLEKIEPGTAKTSLL